MVNLGRRCSTGAEWLLSEDLPAQLLPGAVIRARCPGPRGYCWLMISTVGRAERQMGAARMSARRRQSIRHRPPAL
jgi:hypothetical protein